MSTFNNLPYSNQFERGHSFNWAGQWKSNTHYFNDEYVTDFVVCDGMILACRSNHLSSETLKPKPVVHLGRIVDVDSPYWSFIMYPEFSGQDSILSAWFVATATEEDQEKDNSVIIGDPYIALMFSSEVWTYVPVKQIIQQYKVGVPMLTQAMYDELPAVDKPDPYILIPDESDLSETKAGNYLDILFSAIRKLQAEVARLRNSFNYGIESYTGKDTAMSKVVSEYELQNDEEPLWSVEPEDLSDIEDVTIDFKSIENYPQFLPLENIQYNANGYVKINAPVVWTDSKDGFQSNGDTKIFLYLTLTDLSVDVFLKDINGNNTLNINLANASNIYSTNDEKYNVCILISRHIALDEETPDEYGKNYIWLSIGTFSTNLTLVEGYYNPSTQNLSKFREELDTAYTIQSVTFPKCEVYKFNGYSKWQDFSHEVIPSKPNDNEYKYKVAHLAIRSVANYNVLESIEDQLINNELIIQEDNHQLWIKSNGGLYTVGGSSNPIIDTGMTEQEMLDKLEELGIVYIDSDKGLQLSNIGDVTFINSDTGKKFKFNVNSEGELKSTVIPQRTLSDRINALNNSNFKIKTTSDYRGFIAKLLASEDSIDPTPESGAKDLGLNSDRVKIGSIYCPLTTDKKFGCTHGFIELENTSDSDIPLDGCYLHYMHPNINGTIIVEHLELDGEIKAGSTYLIRCKQYADKDTDADVFISVDSFDKEWYVNGSLLDLSNDGTSTYAFVLTYGKEDIANESSNGEISALTYFIASDREDSKAPYSYKWYFIDSIILNKLPVLGNNQYWGLNYVTVPSNTIIKTTFELDPAKQAYQALTTYDSSRIRLSNTGTDIQLLNLDKEFIEFPFSDEKFPVSNYTPKSSKDHKNVSTDKTKLNKEKPNMVTCSFGINPYTTRTFNWISCGQFDEYVWLKQGNNWIPFESYKKDETGTTADTFPRKKIFSQTCNNIIYARITGMFPGDESIYTSHKCIINITANAPSEKTEYTYIVGRADKTGLYPDFDHCSDEYTFTLYPSTYVPRIYQTTDQQGFHWIEYQVWAAAAKEINRTINSATLDEAIIPILLNTGDMTQNGTRINEWLDYYNAGIDLFKHLEQVNVVGNNDLCNTDPEILGTGDDNGKSNGFYFHVFYCYEVDENNLPIIVGDDGRQHYVPSLYNIDFNNYRLVIVNSEITYVNCDKWFNRHKNGQVVNVYTGWAVPTSSSIESAGYDSGFTSIYSMVYNMLTSRGARNAIAICHEMPFTVITNDSLDPTNAVKSNYRSLSGSGTSLIGSHTNQINAYDKIGMHWFSRLLEHANVKLCLGGHKHTYACTFPICEYYYYDNGTKNSKDDGPMTMGATLQNDNSVSWIYNGENLSKMPLVDQSSVNRYGTPSDSSHFSPVTKVLGLDSNDMYHPVTYMMCQATGYKLTSNKELPSNYQHYSRIIPQTTDAGKADSNQRRPMFTIVDMNNNNYTIKLVRIENILSSNTFTQQTHSKNPPYYQYALDSGNSRYCSWQNTAVNLITI